MAPITLNESLEKQQWFGQYLGQGYPTATPWHTGDWNTDDPNSFDDIFSVCADANPFQPPLSSYSPSGGTIIFNVLQDFATSSSAAFQLASLQGLLGRGQPGVISTLQTALPQLAAATNQNAKSDILSTLKNRFRSTDPTAVRQLAALAAAPTTPADLRDAAISSLVALHTRESLPFLAGLLQSQDPDERMKGVFGISSFANNLPAEAPKNFKTLAFLTIPASGPYQTKQTIANFSFGKIADTAKEQSLVTFWQTWWTEHPELH